ncbi:hypothetical protein GN958_ATG00454 [Phytophthora infestans]|uniref:Uncharacterized protein n=1 Tax=Phytophthora infestans TaxID=4787 RepID=A0A8S9VCE5_PHYIN|nr:hypothetical protein GN958_ATG00436 [Phytophthora infestans]KAF4150383.1 hypothetical protein GN958_ATG00440 [Phytophthora infestans]KAF4150393.1 hypothetical protein GN958_ATG00450 [Phytophthora infestans]KAF4150397.1 hypothetical protein GN958_ATG00454 [Phytophthora infestans]
MDNDYGAVIWRWHTNLEQLEVVLEIGVLKYPVSVAVQRSVDTSDYVNAEDDEPPDCKPPIRKLNEFRGGHGHELTSVATQFRTRQSPRCTSVFRLVKAHLPMKRCAPVSRTCARCRRRSATPTARNLRLLSARTARIRLSSQNGNTVFTL